MKNNCIILNVETDVDEKQRNMVKRMIEKGTPAYQLGAFVKKIGKRNPKLWQDFMNLSDDELLTTLTELLIEEAIPEHKKYVHNAGTPLLTLNDFNRADLTSQERKDIKDNVKFNVVNECLFDIVGNSGQVRPLEQLNENVLKCKLRIMLELASGLGIDTPITSTRDLFYAADDNGEYLLQSLYEEILAKYDESIFPSLKTAYNTLIYFDTILLSEFENVIGLDSEYEDDGYIYLNKYVYLGPGANMRKGYQDNKSEGFADAFENMSNMTKMIANYIPKYMNINGEDVQMGYIGEKNAVFIFAELWDFMVSVYKSPGFDQMKNDNPSVFTAISNAVKNPAGADWGVIVKHYMNTRCSTGNGNIKEWMVGIYKHIFEKGRGTWLYENFVSCIQKYRRTYYGIISNVRKNENPFMEFNELNLWTEQAANFKLQDQIAYSTIANHARYNTPEKRLEYAKQIGLKAIDQNSFSVNIDGKDVVVTVHKDKDTSFSINTNGVSKQEILKFLLTQLNISVSKDALLYFQTVLENDRKSKLDTQTVIKTTGDVNVRPVSNFEQAVAPILGLCINSIFDKEIVVNGTTFKPSLEFKKKYFGGIEIDVYNYSSYFTHLARMAEILQIVHNQNTSNVIKNGKGNNVPTTQLATIQQDGPILDTTIKEAEKEVRLANRARFKKVLQEKKSKTQTFKSISRYNPMLSQAGFCEVKSFLSAGIANGPIVKESKELKAGELMHNEIMYLFAQKFFEKSEKGGNFIYSQATANADKNLQALRGLALDQPISYRTSMGLVDKQNYTLRSIIRGCMDGNHAGIYEYYKLHNAQATLALENNICHSYNCAFIDYTDWQTVDNIEDLMAQLIKLRYQYLHPPIETYTTNSLREKVLKSKSEIQKEIDDYRKGRIDWTLSSVKNVFRKKRVDFNETTFGVSAKVKGSLDGALKGMDAFDCVQFPKDMFRDIQIARKAVNNDFDLLKEQSDYYEKTFICDLISERCDINTTTDNYFKELLIKQPALLGSWVTKSGDMILAKIKNGDSEIVITSYSNIDDINAFKKADSRDIVINPILHAYHMVQFAFNTQMNEAYNGTRFSITAKKDDGVYVQDLSNFSVITKESIIPKRTIFGTDDDQTSERKKRYNDYIDQIKSEWEKNYLKVENLRMVDYYKRATVNGTREHRILHGDKYNIPERVHIAIIEDPEGEAILNSAASVQCKAQDGSIWVTPWHALQIDAGSGEAKLPPGVRKTMYHDIDPITGGATLLKMAEFVITNEMRRLSQKDKMNMDMLLMKLANRKRIEFQSDRFDEIDVAIRNLNSFFSTQTFYEQQKYYAGNPDFGKFYAFQIKVERNGSKLDFIKTRWEVAKDGSELSGKEVLNAITADTIYQIDRIFGGAYSCDKTKNGLVLGEAQNKIVNKIICELNLKDNYVAYAVNKESIKNNIKNVNSSSEWFDVRDLHYQGSIDKLNTESTLWTTNISTKFGGIILNALHEMDEDVDVARGVQMLSEMIQNGNQYGEVENIYSNVRLGIQDALKDYVAALNSDTRKELQQLIFDTIVDSLTNGKDKTKISLAQEFVLGMKKAKEEKGISSIGFPISDKALYDLLITTIVGKINREGIRARNSGFGGVKHPSFGVAQIFDIYEKDEHGTVRKLYAKHNDLLDKVIEFLNTEEGKESGWTAEELLTKHHKTKQVTSVIGNATVTQKVIDWNPFIGITKDTTFNVDLGETILYEKGGKVVSFEITNDRDYQYFKRSIEPTITECYKNVLVGRRLRGYRTECQYVEKGKVKHDMMFNTDTRYLISSMVYVKDALKKIRSFISKNSSDSSIPTNLKDFIKSTYFEVNCKRITGQDFIEGYTDIDLIDRIDFINNHFKDNENFRDFFTKILRIENIGYNDFDEWYKSRYNVTFDSGRGFNIIDEVNCNIEGNIPEEAIDKKRKNDINIFNRILAQYLEDIRLIGIERFTEQMKFDVTKLVKIGDNYEFRTFEHDIKSSKIRKAEYMKSKGNIAKQYLIDRRDSLYNILKQGPAYFEQKLHDVYQEPDDKKLLYDVIIYDKSRRPIYLKLDLEHKYADYFLNQKGEYTYTINGIFRETQGSIYYKDKKVCSSNKLSSWIKHGENGEKYNVVTVFDRNVFEEILKGKYGKNSGFVTTIVPRTTINEIDASLISGNRKQVELSAWQNELLKQGLHDNSQIDPKLIELHNKFMEQGLSQIDSSEFEEHWKTRSLEIAQNNQNDLINSLVENHILQQYWHTESDTSFDSWIKREARQMFDSFKKQLSAIGTRIPSQAMQSMMAMECVGYIDADYNEEMASIEMTYIQGSDYDIDKDYITEYFVSETGFVGDGSKLQNYEAFDDLIDLLPLPNESSDSKQKGKMGQNIKYMRFDRPSKWKEDGNYYETSYEEVTAILNWIDNPRKHKNMFNAFRNILIATNNGKKIKMVLTEESAKTTYLTIDDYNRLKKFVSQIYKEVKVSDVKKWFKLDKNEAGESIMRINVSNEKDFNTVQYLISDYANWKRQYRHLKPLRVPNYLSKLHNLAYYINQHQTSVVTTQKDSQNISLSKELKILSNPKNIAAMEVSVDLSLTQLKDFATEHGVQSENGLSVWSAASKFKAQDTNLLGKTGVGVAANADKVYFTVYYYHTKMLNKIAERWKEFDNLPNEEKTGEKKIENAVFTIKHILKTLTVNPFKEDDIRCLSKLNWNILKDVPDFNVWDIFDSTADISTKQREWFTILLGKTAKFHSVNESDVTFDNLVEYLKTIGKDVDGPTLLSALVSAATDNAKELVLSKLNAFGDILDAYGMCASLGMKFEDTAKVFTSPLLNSCVKEIRGDVFDPANFASKLEGSLGMFSVDFTDSEDNTRINSILSAKAISSFTSDLEFDSSVLNFLGKSAEELISDNYVIDDIITAAKVDIGNNFSSYSEEDIDYFDWDYVLENEIEMYDDNITQGIVEWSEARLMQKLAYVSFLKRIKLRNNAIIAELRKPNGSQLVDAQLKNLKDISSSLLPKLYEQQILHKLLGVTKGIEGKPQQLYRYMRELEYFVNKKYEENKINERFNFLEFFKNPEYADKHIAYYEKIREFTNVLDCLYQNEYISEMLKTVGDTNTLLTQISFVYGHTQKIAKAIEDKLELSRPLNHKEYPLIQNLVNEWTVYQFLTYHDEHLGIKINIDPSRDEYVYSGTNLNNPNVRKTELRINEMADIQSFKRLANLFFFSDLMQDYAEHPAEFSEEKTNIFLESVIPGGYLRIIPNEKKIDFAEAVPEMLWKVAYNLNEDISDESSEYALQMKKDFERIFNKPLRYKDENGEWKNRGITIGDFIYLYNLVVYKNSGTRNSFTKLFENAEGLSKISKILPKHNAFIAALDSGFRDYDFTKDTMFMRSVMMKLGAMKNSKLKDVIKKDMNFESPYTGRNYVDYPFEFVVEAGKRNNASATAQFYDEMTKIITQNTVDKTNVSMEKPGIYYVQRSMLPANPTIFLEEHGNKFVYAETMEDIENADLTQQYVIITDPNLLMKANNRYDITSGFVHSETELLSSDIKSIEILSKLIHLPYNSNFLTVLENTATPSIRRIRPLLLRDSIRRLWNSTKLTENGYDFSEMVKFVTNNDVGEYTDHRRFARGWFEQSEDGTMVVYINIDNCDNENVLLHEMAHVLLLMNKYIDIDHYHEVANEFLQAVHEGDINVAWDNFKKRYAKTGLVLSDDLLFDEFLIDAIDNQTTQQNVNLSNFVQSLLIEKPSNSTMYKKHMDAYKIISSEIAKGKSGKYEIKCE